MTNDDRVDYLIGQVATLKAFCVASIIAHPEPDKLLAHFNRAAEHTEARLLPTEARDAVVDGSNTMVQQLRHVLEGEARRRARPDIG